MGTDIAELKKLLRKNGWKLLQNGSKHDIYRKGEKTLLVPRGTKMYSRNYRHIRWQIEGKTNQSKVDLFNLHSATELCSSPPLLTSESNHESLTDA